MTSRPQVNHRLFQPRESTTPTISKLGQTHDDQWEDHSQTHWEKHLYKEDGSEIFNHDHRCGGKSNKHNPPESDHWESPIHIYDCGEWEEYSHKDHGQRAEPSPKQKSGCNVTLYCSALVVLFLSLAFLFTLTDSPEWWLGALSLQLFELFLLLPILGLHHPQLLLQFAIVSWREWDDIH